MPDAGMQFLGEIDGKNVYWAEPGRFDTPGIHFWDGKRNVHVPVPMVDEFDCVNPDISQASFTHLAAELVRRGATVMPAPHGGDYAAAAGIEAPA